MNERNDWHLKPGEEIKRTELHEDTEERVRGALAHLRARQQVAAPGHVE